jgi:sterol 3beta-glucosyltransferase
LTVSNLSEALNAATTDSKQISRAKFIGEQIRGEDGVTVAIESIYRDLEYARSLIKHHGVDDLEGISEVDGTIRNHDDMSPSSLSGYSSGGSIRGAPSEDWSVISEQDGRQSSSGSRGQASKKRRSLVSPASPISQDSTTEPQTSRSVC